ncbi:hypothetical protein FRC09_012405, partial [Ceratobasidium sp. 395]
MQEAMDQIGRELLQPQTTIDSEIALMPTADQPEALTSEPAQIIIPESDQTLAAYNLVNASPLVIMKIICHTSASNVLPASSPAPDQEEIETWLIEYKKQRRSSRSNQDRLAPIVCPLPGCGQVLRRPQALK